MIPALTTEYVKMRTNMNKNGLNIRLATFLWFNGDKEPDIDLNFAGEYQPIAHKFCRWNIFGEEILKAEQLVTAGYVKKYEENSYLRLYGDEEDHRSTSRWHHTAAFDSVQIVKPAITEMLNNSFQYKSW